MKRRFALATVLALASCNDHASTGAVASAPRASSSALVAAAPSATLPAPHAAWYVGTWTGSYQSVAHHLDLSTKLGGLAEWSVDDGKRGVGAGALTVTPASDGTVTGTASGALGNATLTGAFDGDALALRLFPAEEGPGFTGVVVAHRDGDGLVGTLHAATSDGHVARDATVTLSRAK